LRRFVAHIQRQREVEAEFARDSACVSIRQHTPAYVGIHQHTSAHVSIRQHTSEEAGGDLLCDSQCNSGEGNGLANVRDASGPDTQSMTRWLSACVSIRQHTSAHMSIARRERPRHAVHESFVMAGPRAAPTRSAKITTCVGAASGPDTQCMTRFQHAHTCCRGGKHGWRVRTLMYADVC
jgi:hypothetical protein